MISTQESLEYRKQILTEQYHRLIAEITRKYIQDIRNPQKKDNEAIIENFQRELRQAREELSRGYAEVLGEERVGREAEHMPDILFDQELSHIVKAGQVALEKEYGPEETRRILAELDTRERNSGLDK